MQRLPVALALRLFHRTSQSQVGSKTNWAPEPAVELHSLVQFGRALLSWAQLHKAVRFYASLRC